MTDHIKIRPADGVWVVRAAGAVIGETRNALELIEGENAPVIYFPRADIAMAFIDTSNTVATGPHMGTASYYSVVAKSGEIKDAAWSYEDPPEAVAQIKGHLAFLSPKIAVEQL